LAREAESARLNALCSAAPSIIQPTGFVANEQLPAHAIAALTDQSTPARPYLQH
jgi:hypothetical protein